MPKLPRPCLTCGQPTHNGSRCPQHTTTPTTTQRATRSPYRAAYTSSEYRTNKRLAYTRAQGQCEATTNNRRCPNPATDCDHITDLADAGTNHLDNLQYLCRTHHQQKTARTRANRATRKREGG